MADTVAEGKAVTLADATGNAHALVYTLPYTLVVVEAVGDTPGDTKGLLETLAGVRSLLWPE